MAHSTVTGIDSSKAEGAEELARMIRAYWRKEGYHEIQATVERVLVRKKTVNGEKVPIYSFSIRSNLGPAGYPPQNGVHYK